MSDSRLTMSYLGVAAFVLTGAAILNPAGLIAGRNIRAAYTNDRDLDTAYVLALGKDAWPTICSNLSSVKPPQFGISVLHDNTYNQLNTKQIIPLPLEATHTEGTVETTGYIDPGYVPAPTYATQYSHGFSSHYTYTHDYEDKYLICNGKQLK
jgi:hypothetical protein